MRSLRALFLSSAFHVTVLTLAVAAVFLRSTIVPMDDDSLYQQFIETLAHGRVDFSIPGFHGASFLAVPLYLLTGFPHANILFQVLCAIALVPAAYFAARSFLNDQFQAVLFTYAMAMMPFYFFISLRGFTFASFTLCVLLTLALRGKGSGWVWLPLGISFLIKPFSIALLPLLLWWNPNKQTWKNGSRQLGLALVFPLIYVIAEYLQIGRVFVGVHPTIDQANVFQWWKFPLNVVHGFQMLFSIHNYYPLDPALTGPGNLVHGSPLLLFLGLFGLLYLSTFWRDRRLGQAIAFSIGIAYILAALLDHMDHFYLEAAVLLLTLAGIPVLAKYQRLLPVILFSLHFQFVYLYLQYRGIFFPDFSLFLIPVVADVLALVTGLLWLTQKPMHSWLFWRRR